MKTARNKEDIRREILARYRYLWNANPLWLRNMPGIPDPRKDPLAARRAAFDLLYPVETTPEGGALKAA